MSRQVFTDVQLGQRKTFEVVWTNELDAATDATTVVTMLSPSGLTTTPTVTHGATGHYTITVTFDESLIWYGKFAASGALIDVEMFEVRVDDSPFT